MPCSAANSRTSLWFTACALDGAGIAWSSTKQMRSGYLTFSTPIFLKARDIGPPLSWLMQTSGSTVTTSFAMTS